MKRTLIYAVAMFAITSVALIFGSYANAKTDNSRVSNVDNNLPFPTNNWRVVKHSFQLHIPQNDKPLSQLIIETPSTVAVSNDIEVLYRNGQKVNINVSVNGKQIIINFPEKVISNTKLLINFNKVKQPITSPASVYHLSVKVVGSNTEIPVGVAQFPTF